MQTSEKVIRIPFVDLRSQYLSIKEEIDEAIASVLDQTAFIGGAQVKAFEEAFAAYCGVDHCVGVANGTDALFIALRTLGIGPGDEVITAANSFVATSEAIKMAGAQVVFVDVDPATYNIDVTQVEAKVTARTKAIIPVHLYGQPADMDPLRTIAASYGLKIVGDAAQAHGALYKGQPIALLADITCYSFYPGKNLGAYGDAGALVMNNAEWAASARMFANHGRSDKYNHAFEGVNSRLDGLQAAILNVKLRHIETWTEQRRRAAESYRRALAGRKVTVPQELDDVRAVYHLFVVRVPAERRDALQALLKTAGVDTGVHYPIALPLLAAYTHLEHTAADFPVAAKASQEIVSLPIFPELTDEQVAYVASRLEEFGL
jgi:dTDP-4-amino-4,6-dideoxygalactose transaminase